MMTLALFFLGAFALSLILVPACRSVARRTGRVAAPTADRWHRHPTALFGGVAICVATLAASAFVRPFPHIALYIAVGLTIFIVGLTDDLMPLKPVTKLVAQLGLASAFVFFGYRLQWMSSQTLDVMFTVLWIVGITNALNLLDNMDGLCAGIALIAGATILAGLATVPAAHAEASYLAAMLGAIAGFLVYNIHPASIFMGDSGSLFIGLTLAGMSLELPRQSRESNVLAIVAAPLLVMLIPIFDTSLVAIMRVASGRAVSQGGRDHSSHRLVAIGLPEKTAVMVLWTLAAVGATTAWAIRQMSLGSGVVPVVLFALSMVLFAAFLTRVKVYEGTDPRVRQGRVTTLVTDFMYKRRVAEVLLDFFLISVAYYAAYRLRYEGERFNEYFPNFLQSLPIVLGVQMTTLFALGAYRGVWRHFGLMDGVVIAKSVALGTLIIEFCILYLFRFQDYSRAAYIIYAALLMLLATGSRASFRVMSEFIRRRRAGDRIIIYGAGAGGALALRELIHNERSRGRLLGFIDDDRGKHRTSLQGYRVLGGYDTLLALVTAGALDEVVISTGLVDLVRLSELEQLCSTHSVRLFRLRVQIEPMSRVS